MQAQAPTGTVTLVFTDVQGSSTLWERSPGPMRAALAEHNRILRDLLAAEGGYEVKTEGDAFMVAFAQADRAVHWCLWAQEALLAADWPAELLDHPDAAAVASPDGATLFRGLRVRMGAHLGHPECLPDPNTGRMDYFGRMVNRAARVSGIAHGGQIVIGDSVRREIAPNLARLGEPAVLDLGEHRLKGLEGAERIWQILPRSLAGRAFPGLKSLSAGGTNLPAHPASFVGRHPELAALGEILDTGSRLITVLGPGGMGKTRLASRFAATRLEDFQGPGRGGVWFADLCSCLDAADVCAAVAQALRIARSPGQSLEGAIDQVGQAIADRGDVLLVLDNFEQLVACGPATVGRWLELAPRAIILVTSRERLRLRGERVLELPPLALPADRSAEASDAERLFLERARAVRPGYAAGEGDLGLVRQIVHTLDGIPLAIELAAARAAILPPGQLLARLRRSLDLLAAGARDAPTRQATLRATMDWSWELLEPWERSAFAQCAVFRGGWDLAAAEAVIDLTAHPDAPPALDVLQALKDKSLLRPGDPDDARARFGMYVPLREYAALRLVPSGEEPGALARHTAHFAARCSGIAPWYQDRLEPRLAELGRDLENLHAAFGRTLTCRPATADTAGVALAVGLVLETFAARRGPIEIRFAIQDAAISYAREGGGDSPLLGWFIEARGRGLITAGRLAESRAAFEAAEAYGRERGIPLLAATALRGQALVARNEDRLDDSLRLCEDSLATMRELGDVAGQGLALGSLASFWQQVSRLDKAIAMYDEALRLFRNLDSPRLECEWRINLGLLNQEAGRLDLAEAQFDLALATMARTGDFSQEGYALGFLAGLDFERGRLGNARERYLDAINTLGRVGERYMRFMFLANLAGCLAQADNLAEADVTLAAAERFGAGGGSAAAVVLASVRGIIHLAHARRLRGLGDLATAAEHVRAAEACLAVSRAPLPSAGTIAGAGTRAVDQSEDVRFAARMLEKALQAETHGQRHQERRVEH
ncbi:MAG: tetratricopeptide repeat protein [Candidatus Sericytochromatia bacterium]|nr:tetratricopeptide repeat protein [Candidatus Tanganyikabacteria bacterium]